MLDTLRGGQKLAHLSAANSYRYDESSRPSKALKLFFCGYCLLYSRKPSYICRGDE